VRFLHETVQCAASSLQHAQIAQSAFPLGELPAPALALVLFWLPLSDAAVLAVVSRKFATAFRDNVSWKRRCMVDLKGIDVEAVFAKEEKTSWMSFYRRHAVCRIRVVTVFYSMSGHLISGDFTIECAPHMTVKEFLAQVSADPKNRQKGAARLQPHDPSKLGRNNRNGFCSANPHAKPNCEFRQDDPGATIADAGLVNGAVLEQRERMLCD
jgi:hypothetical protein